MKQFLLSLCCLCTLHSAAQNVLNGTITDADGQALTGVTIQERGTGNGAVSGADGRYSLRYGRNDAILVFVYTGYVTQDIRVDGRTTLDVVMQPDNSLLDQVIIVGSRRQNRVQTETPVPVDIINVGALSLTTARMDVTSLLNYNAPSFNYNRQSGSDGADHIDLATLRGLGPDQTLVLVNGKRRHYTAFVSVFGTRGRGNSGTDLNALPAAAIDRVEILRDGASAQYGSDAIAGVLNLVLKKNAGQGSADLGFSGYLDSKYNPAYKPELNEYIGGNKLDGAAYNASFNYGLPIGGDGVVNVTLNYAGNEKTFRQDLGGTLPVNSVRRAHGDASLQSYGAFFNAEIPLTSDRFQLYAFGGYNRKASDAYAFTRNFSADRTQNGWKRTPTDAAGGAIDVPGITRRAADGTPYFNPRIATTIQDASFSAGFQSTAENGLYWDLSNTTGFNRFEFMGKGTFNAGLGADQTQFDDGGFSFLQNTTNLNVSKAFDDVLSGFNLAFGAEYRFENYRLFAGEPASWQNYDPAKASGAQGFPGYQPADETDATRSCAGLYGDVELDITEKFLVGGAVRLERYSDFGFTTNFKAASRFKLAENLNLRGSVSTGFRAPSLQQINFSSTFTTVQGGKISEVKIAPNEHPITESAGIPALKQERSLNAALGFSFRPARDFSITLDAYSVQVKDRVVLSGQFSADDPSLNPLLTNELARLRVGLAQFFANAVNTTNRGLDLVFDYNRRRRTGHVRALLTANFQKMTIDKINVPERLNNTEALRATFLSDREQRFILASAPPVKMTANVEFGRRQLTLGARFNFFGRITLLGYGEDGLGIDPMVPTDADPTRYVEDKFVYGAKLVPDLYMGWQFNEKLSLYLGVDNVLNVHPDLGYVAAASGWAFNNETGGPWDAVQMGGNGLRAFARVGLRF
jgi:iron complex outermembrane recepter protein